MTRPDDLGLELAHISTEQRRENVHLSTDVERPTLAQRLATYRRQRTARGATLDELTLLDNLDCLVRERLHLQALALEASRTDSTGKEVRLALDRLRTDAAKSP